MKRYKVYVYNTLDKFWDCYEVNAIDPVDARNVAVQRLVEEMLTPCWRSSGTMFPQLPPNRSLV